MKPQTFQTREVERKQKKTCWSLTQVFLTGLTENYSKYALQAQTCPRQTTQVCIVLHLTEQKIRKKQQDRHSAKVRR